MDSLIIDLQKDILENKDIKSILNKALMISNELELKEFNEWINFELNGYKDNMDILPSYRILECEVRYDSIGQAGLNLVTTSRIPMMSISEDIDYKLREVKVYQSILELIHICEINHENVHFKLDFKIENLLKGYIGNAIEIYRVCPIFQIEAIIDHVKKEIMNWCSELKKNKIFGESYNFTDEERETAKNINIISPMIHIGNTNVQINNISFKENIFSNLREIRNILDENDVDDELFTTIINNIVIIEEELNKEESDISIMKKSAQFMKDFLNQITVTAFVNLLLQNVNEILNILSSI